MPYEWVPPELFLEHSNVAVYRTYNGESNMESSFWFTTDPADCDYKNSLEIGQFDVRDLPGWIHGRSRNFAGSDHFNRQVIKRAIDNKIITDEPAEETPGWTKEWPLEPGQYWFYGIEVPGLSNISKLFYVTVSVFHLVSKSTLIYRNERGVLIGPRSIGVWQPVKLPIFPKEEICNSL